VNGQTAWSLLQKAERFDIKIVTSLDEAQTEKMRLTNISVSSLITHHSSLITSSSGFIIPNGAKIKIIDSF
nr:hypothetical protein [Pyrinomonadaceae bacterium]